MTDKLIKDLKFLHSDQGIRPDFIFFTGDAAYGAAPGEKMVDQYKDVSKFLDAVRESFDPEIPKENFYIVPGNHDIDRDEVTPDMTEWLRDSRRTRAEIISAIRDGKRQWSNWMARLHAYRQFLKDYGLTHLATDDPHLIWADSKVINEVKVGIVGINSAWSCADKSDKGQLWTGAEWQIPQTKSRLGQVDFTIALIHHPSNWLNHQEDPLIAKRLLQEFDVVLHGHEHIEAVARDGNESILISAGACYQCEWMSKGYNFTQINTDGSGGKTLLRTWDEIGQGWVAKNICGKAPDGTQPLSELPKLKSLKKNSIEVHEILDSSKVISLDEPVSPQIIQSKIQTIRRRPCKNEIQHANIRQPEQSKFKSLLTLERYAWLVADWQMGKEGFISSVLSTIGGENALSSVFRLDCGKAESIDQIIDSSETQLGLAFVEFAELLKGSEDSTLLFEDVPVSLLQDSAERFELNRKIQTVLNFSPKLRVALISRQFPIGIDEKSVVSLGPLDPNETIRYLKNHPRAQPTLWNHEFIDQIHSYVGGLPTAIDKLIEQNEYLSISEIIDEDDPHSIYTKEPIPESLKADVDSVFKGEDDRQKRTLSLLKLLTVLKDGETFESIRRIYHAKPFSPGNVTDLTQLSLVECIPISQTAEDLLPSKATGYGIRAEPPKLLRVPRQVRDYVGSMISDEERAEIYNVVLETFFGNKWSQGKVTLRRSLFTAYQRSSISRPGNELLVVQYLLQVALEARRKDRITRYAQLALEYCGELMAHDKFREVVIVGGAISKILNTGSQDEYWTKAAYLYGRALRMTGQHQEAINMLEDTFQRCTSESKDFRCAILLNLAMAHKATSLNAKAIIYANEAIKFTEVDSAYSLQAQAVVIQITKNRGLKEQALSAVYKKALNMGYSTAANNIALDLAKISKSRNEALKYLDSVIFSAKDPYNLTRAIINKADLLLKQGKINDLTPEEQRSLCSAYAYSYSQRINTLLDSCHEVLWGFYLGKGFLESLFKLFRYSSFVWCLTDRKAIEDPYRKQLAEIRSTSEGLGSEIEVEVVYLENRILAESGQS